MGGGTGAGITRSPVWITLLSMLAACGDSGPSGPGDDGLSWEVLDFTNSGLPHEWTNRIAFEEDGAAWIGTFADGVARFDGTTWEVFDVVNSDLPSNSVRDLTVDDQGRLWVATGDGLARYDGNGWRVYDEDNAPLPVPHVSAVAVDAEGEVWAGSGNVSVGGLLALDGSDWEAFTPIDSELPCGIVEVIEVDDAGGIWVGTSQCMGAGGVARIEAGIWDVFDIDRSPMPYNAVESLAFDGLGGVWLGSQASFFADPDILHGALLRFDGVRWEQSPPAASGKTSNRVTALEVDGRGRLWVATSPDGTFNYELAVLDDGRWQVLSDLDADFPHPFIQDLALDREGRIWAASDQGVIIIETESVEVVDDE